MDWIKVLKSSFMLLFIAYPGVALNVMRMFNCMEVEGRSYLVADMRLECYTSTWAGSVSLLALAVITCRSVLLLR